jgi:hypothetical protein
LQPQQSLKTQQGEHITMRNKFSLGIIAALILAAFGAVGLSAQGNQTYQQRWYFASDFGQWAVRGQQANTYQWSPGTVCNVSANGSATSFFAFATNAPVEIVDSTPANDEVATPSAVNQTTSYCSIALSLSHNHYSFQVVSGTGGLQETLNSISASASAPALIWIDRNWYALANAVPGTTPAAIITAAAGKVTAILVDDTTAPFSNYVWNGSGYTTGTNTWVNTKPSVTSTGGAAGTATAVSTTGTALAGNVYLTTGTASTGVMFTLTWAASHTQFDYAPTCTFASIGTNVGPTLTPVSTGSSGSAATAAPTTAVAPASTTAYVYSYSCY